MDTSGYQNRIRLLLVLIGLTLLAMVGRLWVLQLTQWVKYAERAAWNRTNMVWEAAPRGRLLDRAGRILAENTSQWDIEVVPADYPKNDNEASENIIHLLAEILGPEASVPQLRESIKKALQEPALESVVLTGIGENVSRQVVARIEVDQLKFPGIQIGTRVRRHYPQDDRAAHVLGYARCITQEQYEGLKDLLYPCPDPAQAPPPPRKDRIYDRTAVVGQSGVEQLLENWESGGQVLPVLQGRRGYRLYAVGDPVWLISQREPVPGATVYLTLDSRLQKIAEEALDEAIRRKEGKAGKAGAAILMDVRTGEVLALASRPAYSLNKWVEGFTPEEWQRLEDDPRNPLLNHAIGGCYPPGSVFKMISAYAALATTDLKINDYFNCRGVIHEGEDNQPFRCWQRKGHGLISFYQGLAQSCDVYFYELVRARGLNSDALADYSRRFGLGELTGIGLAGERTGFVPDRRWKHDVRQERWYTGDTLHFAIGQGYLSVTPLQMAVVTAAVANGGILLRPRLVRKIQWPDWLGYGTQVFNEPDGKRIDIDDELLAQVRKGMNLAVTAPHGTATMMRGLGFSVAAKTGSAEHRPGRPTHAWFVCYAPVNNPKYAACVLIEEGGYGGEVAGPVARKLIAAALTP